MQSEVYSREIAASAELLRERIRNGHTGNESTYDGEVELLEPSDLEDLREHTDVDDVEQYVNFGTWPDGEDLPEWVTVFENILEYLSTIEDPSLSREFDDPYPFAEILFPVVEYATRNFIDDVDSERLSEKSFQKLQEQLLNRLVHEGGLALHMDYTEYVRTHGAGEVELSPDSTRWYDEYTTEFLDGRAVTFFETFPVLARVFTILARHWGSHVSRFVSRLNDDYDAIRSLIGVDELGGVARVESGAGDVHDGGQSVMIVEFESGDEIVYKPRSVAPEKELYGFEDWLHEAFDDFPELQTPGVLEMANYGWVEMVEHGTFSEVASVRAYYERAGALLCVLYVLDVADCHFQNLIAGDVSPVIIDAETIMHINVSIGETSDAHTNRKLRESVIRSTVFKTEMLPYMMEDGENSQSGLAMLEVRESDAFVIEWDHENTDAVTFDYERPTATPETNYPTYGGDPAAPDLFVEEIVEGFETAYDVIANSKATVTRRVEEQFAGIRVRQILQLTELYRALLETLSNPEHLRSGVKQDLKIRKTLVAKWNESQFVEEPDEDILRAEGEALFRRDVPRFYLMSDTDELYIGNRKVASGFFETSGIERVQEKVGDMSEEDKEYQKGLIRTSLEDFSAGWGPDGGENQ